MNGNAPSAGAAPHCRVEPRVPQPLTPWGRVPRAARPSGTEPGSVPVSPGRGNAAPRLCRRLGLRSSPRTPPAPPKHPSPSRLCRRSPGRCHPAVFRTALSQPVPNCLSALRCGRRSARHGGLCGHTAVRRAASGLAGSTAGSAVGAPQREGLGRVGGCGRAEAQLQNRTSRSSAEPRVTAGAAWPLPSGAAAGAVHRSDSELPADVRAHSCTYVCVPSPPPSAREGLGSVSHAPAQPPLRDAEPDLEQHRAACGAPRPTPAGCRLQALHAARPHHEHLWAAGRERLPALQYPRTALPAPHPAELQSTPCIPAHATAPRAPPRRSSQPLPSHPAPPHPAPFPSRSATSGGRPWAAFVPPAAPGASPRGSGSLISASLLGSGVRADPWGPSGSLQEGPTPSQRVPEPQRISPRTAPLRVPPRPGTPLPPPPGAPRAAPGRQHGWGCRAEGLPRGFASLQWLSADIGIKKNQINNNEKKNKKTNGERADAKKRLIITVAYREDRPRSRREEHSAKRGAGPGQIPALCQTAARGPSL